MSVACKDRLLLHASSTPRIWFESQMAFPCCIAGEMRKVQQLDRDRCGNFHQSPYDEFLEITCQGTLANIRLMLKAKCRSHDLPRRSDNAEKDCHHLESHEPADQPQPIESTFATVRLRTHRTKGCGSGIATLTMFFKLGPEAQKHWRRLQGFELIPMVVTGVRSVDGEEQTQQAA